MRKTQRRSVLRESPSRWFTSEFEPQWAGRALIWKSVGGGERVDNRETFSTQHPYQHPTPGWLSIQTEGGLRTTRVLFGNSTFESLYQGGNGLYSAPS